MSPRTARGQPRRPRRRVRGGFTLVELLVTLVIAGITTTAAMAIVASVTDVREGLRRGGDEMIGAYAARETIGAWLRAASLSPAPEPFVGVAGREGALPRDQMYFDVSDAGVLHPGPHRVHLWCAQSEKDGEWALYAELLPRRGDARADTLLMAPRVAGLAARYRGRDRGGEAWRDWWSAGDTLPIAVELRLLAPPGGTLQPVLREALVVRLAWEGTP